jgi:hypothetical protein
MVETNERLARVQRSIAEVEADGRPARLKILLLTALHRERDALLAVQGVDGSERAVRSDHSRR